MLSDLLNVFCSVCYINQYLHMKCALILHKCAISYEVLLLFNYSNSGC